MLHPKNKICIFWVVLNLFITNALAQIINDTNCYIRLASWNIANYGASKDYTKIEYIASILKPFELVAIQEVSSSYKGAQAIGQLIDALNRTGEKWDCVISEPTMGKGVERYAFIWKTSKVKLLGKPYLEKSMELTIDREPFIGIFVFNTTDTIMIANFHAVPKDKNPATENQLLYQLDQKYEHYNLFILGDFNASSRSIGFDNLYKRGMKAALNNQKTSIKMEVNQQGEWLANEYDNIFYEADVYIATDRGAIDFTTDFTSLQAARLISDHLPIWACFGTINHLTNKKESIKDTIR